MFNKKIEKGYKEALPKIKQKTLVFGEKTLMTADAYPGDSWCIPENVNH